MFLLQFVCILVMMRLSLCRLQPPCSSIVQDKCTYYSLVLTLGRDIIISRQISQDHLQPFISKCHIYWWSRGELYHYGEPDSKFIGKHCRWLDT